MLVSPLRCGDPCLNHLHFPPGITQTQHTHPSDRVGAVVRGSGVCVHTDASGRECRTSLIPGLSFVIPADCVHAFETADDAMDVVAFHPDSDTGPKPDDHPMINRTIVDGVSAANIATIRTTELER